MARNDKTDVESLISYINDIKPYHSKLTEVVVEYQYDDYFSVQTEDSHRIDMNFSSLWCKKYISDGVNAEYLIPPTAFPRYSSDYHQVYQDGVADEILDTPGLYHVPYNQGVLVSVNGITLTKNTHYTINEKRTQVQFLPGYEPVVDDKILFNLIFIDKIEISLDGNPQTYVLDAIDPETGEYNLDSQLFTDGSFDVGQWGITEYDAGNGEIVQSKSEALSPIGSINSVLLPDGSEVYKLLMDTPPPFGTEVEICIHQAALYNNITMTCFTETLTFHDLFKYSDEMNVVASENIDRPLLTLGALYDDEYPDDISSTSFADDIALDISEFPIESLKYTISDGFFVNDELIGGQPHITMDRTSNGGFLTGLIETAVISLVDEETQDEFILDLRGDEVSELEKITKAKYFVDDSFIIDVTDADNLPFLNQYDDRDWDEPNGGELTDSYGYKVIHGSTYLTVHNYVAGTDIYSTAHERFPSLYFHTWANDPTCTNQSLTIVVKNALGNVMGTGTADPYNAMGSNRIIQVDIDYSEGLDIYRIEFNSSSNSTNIRFDGWFIVPGQEYPDAVPLLNSSKFDTTKYNDASALPHTFTQNHWVLMDNNDTMHLDPINNWSNGLRPTAFVIKFDSAIQQNIVITIKDTNNLTIGSLSSSGTSGVGNGVADLTIPVIFNGADLGRITIISSNKVTNHRYPIRVMDIDYLIPSQPQWITSSGVLASAQERSFIDIQLEAQE